MTRKATYAQLGNGRLQINMDVERSIFEVSTSDDRLTLSRRTPSSDLQLTDCTVWIEFTIPTQAGDARVFTASLDGSSGGFSRSRGRVPWTVEFSGQRLVIDSDAPWEAYTRIRPFLRGDELDRFEQQVFRQTSSSPSPR